MVADPALGEVSGLGASLAHPGALWALEDSGNPATLTAIDLAGATLAELTLGGVANEDWEDLAVAPCGAGSCLYVADVGDNALVRDGYAIFVAAEPATLASSTVSPEVRAFTYEDGPHDAETLLVEGPTGRVFVVTKTFEVPGVYEVVLEGAAWTAKRRADVTLPEGLIPYFTGGSVRPDGRAVLLRTYGGLWLYEGADVLDALSHVPCQVSAAAEPQSEAVTFVPTGWVTISEGVGEPVYLSACGA